MRNFFSFIQVTLIGGVVFLLPFGIALFALSRISGPLRQITDPLAEWIGVNTVAGIALSELLVILSLILLAFIAGLIGRTKSGQAFVNWMRSGIATVIPAFGLIDGLAQSFEKKTADHPIVLVPTDAGWSLAVMVEPAQEEWCTVFIPGSPELFSGSVAYARLEDIRMTALKPADLFKILRGRGVGSNAICDMLRGEPQLAGAVPGEARHG